jgi:signal-transduction protein with cAMP-binding, CBS, and nucleotidyltransferase domain
MTDQLKFVLKMFANFNEHELEKISNQFKIKTFNKNRLLLQQGNVCKEFYFIINGGIRTYFMDKKGQEKTRYIMLDHHIGTALTSFITQSPSSECIETLEKTDLLSISHANFYRLNEEMENWKIFYQRILEMAYTFQNKRIEHLVTLTAKQRLELVMQDHPVFIQKLSNKILASYLDIREETLSRLKSELH